MRTGKDYSELAIIARELTNVPCILVETHRWVKDWGSFTTERRGGFRYVLTEGCWHGEAVKGLTKKQASL